MWHETARYRVRDENGVLLFVVEMTREIDAKPIIGKQRRVPRQQFYFLLDGQDVRPASDDTFVNLDTGEVLVRVAE